MLKVAALYQFSPVPDPAALRDRLLALAEHAGVKGTLILAHEGINGTIAGPSDAIDQLVAAIIAEPGFDAPELKFSQAADYPFRRLKIRIKPEIVTMGVPADPTARVGRYVDPQDWNALVSAEDVVVIDTRNRYEVAVGTFANAVNPDTASFREFPAWWDENKAHFAGRKVAMFCTGGIRCEKATNYAAADPGVEIYHLKGGVLAYLEHVQAADSLWRGDCFVFDEREGLGHGLVPSAAGIEADD